MLKGTAAGAAAAAAATSTTESDEKEAPGSPKREKPEIGTAVDLDSGKKIALSPIANPGQDSMDTD